MLSIDLFANKFEKKLHEGALDDTITRAQAHLMEPLSRRAADIRTQIRSGKLSGAELDKLEKEYEDLVQKRLDIMLDRRPKNEQQVPSKQDPFAYVKPEPRGIGDIQDPKTKMAQLAQQAKKGPLANVAAGVKAFVKGEPEPMGEEQQAINPRALGVANFQRLVKANMGAYPSVSLEFIRPEENFKLDQRGLDLISDYYDGLENDQAKNYFIYRVLPSGEETLKVLKQLGYSPVQAQQQQNLPGIPTQGELPLQEKKKSDSDDLEAGDVKVARELQKLRAEYPAARSDVEAVARAEIDSTERSQRQLSAIRGANEKQDALLKQLVALDQEQGREIDTIDKENNSLEQRLAQVQATNDRLQQAIGKMTGTKKAATKTTATTVPPTGTVDIAQGGIIDVDTPVATPADQPKEKPTQTTSPALGSMAQQLGGFSKVIPMRSVRPTQPTTDKEPEPQPAPSIRQKKVSGSDIEEHGGGIGPRQHWQSMMPEGQPQELINRYLAINAETDVDAVRKAIQAISRDSTLSTTSKSRLLGQIGMIIQRHRLPIGRSYYQFMQQYMEEQSVTETVENVRAGMAEIYRRLAPKIERYRDSFLAGQLYDELENYAELHGAEREFKQMMNAARNRAHMEYDTNPGGFQNWFWFLPFEDEQLDEISRRDFLKGAGATAGLAAMGAPKGAQAQVGAGENESVYAANQAIKTWKYYARDNDSVTKWIYDTIRQRCMQFYQLSGGRNFEQAITTALQNSASAVEPTFLMFYQQMAQDKEDASIFKAIIAGQLGLSDVSRQEQLKMTGSMNRADLRQTAGKFVQVYTDSLNQLLANLTAPQQLSKQDMDKLAYGLLLYLFAKEDNNTMITNQISQSLSKIIQTYKNKDQINQIYSRMSENHNQEKVKDPAATQRIKKSLYDASRRIISDLDSIGSRGGAEEFKEELVNGAATDDIKKRMSKLEAMALAANRAGDDAKCKMYQQKIQSLKQKLSQSMALLKPAPQQDVPVQESLRPGEYHIHTVYFKDGSKKRIRVTSDEFDVVGYYTKRGQAVDRVDYDYQIHSNMTEAEKEPTTRQELLNRVDKIQRMMTQERNPANLQILRKELEMLKQRYQHLREDSDGGEAVEMAIMRRMLIAHTDLIVEFGLDRVVAAIEEVAYDVGDVDEIGTSDVSAYVRQVQRILEPDNEV
jgi:hypothetical protein